MSARPLASVLIACSLLASQAAALIVASGDGSARATAPADDFGFANVGDARQTAVYLGNGWVITANHVQLGPVTLAGVPYEPVPDSKVRIANRGPGTSPDVALFRLQEPWPELPALRIRATPIRVGEEVWMAGNGRVSGEPLHLEGIRGWHWSDTHALRWGTNRVSAFYEPLSVGSGDSTAAFATDFSAFDATEHEAQVTVGDSGGGVFTKRDGRWELAGVLIAANTFATQPAETTLYGNVTFAADLAAYREQILEVIGQDADAPTRWCDGTCGDGFAISLLVPVALLGRRRFQA